MLVKFYEKPEREFPNLEKVGLEQLILLGNANESVSFLVNELRGISRHNTNM